MKKTILSIAIMLSTAIAALAQTGINYQAVARDNGTVVSSGTANLVFTILDASNGTLWTGNETSQITDGVVNAVIGVNNNVGFSQIDWSLGGLQLKVEVSGSGFSTMTSTQDLQYVPFALYSETAENVINDAVDDADNDASNEIQSLSFSNGTLSIGTSGQSSVDMPWMETGNVIHQTDTTKPVSIGTTQVTSGQNVDLMVEGFTQLGGDNTPGIKTKWIDQFLVQGTSTTIQLGVDATYILSLSVHVNVGGQLIPPNGDSWDLGDSYAYNYDVSGSQLRIRTNTGASTNNLDNKPVQIYIIYRSN